MARQEGILTKQYLRFWSHHRPKMSTCYNKNPSWQLYDSIHDISYEYREMLPITETNVTSGVQLTIMTYNILTICDWRKYVYVDTDFLDIRFQVLLREVSRYNPDIVCLQEVDLQKLSVFEECFEASGYEILLSRHNTVTTMAICYKKDLFEAVHSQISKYSSELHYSQHKNNCAMMLCLKFKDAILDSHPKPSKDGLIIVNTHLTSGWGLECIKREQVGVLFKFMKRFAHYCDVHLGLKSCYTFLAGDFNSEPIDAAYLYLVSKPLTVEVNKSEECPDTSKNERTILNMHLRAISLYSAGYKLVDSANASVNNDKGEPAFSFYGAHWHGVCDYIFSIREWNRDDETDIEPLDELEKYCSIKLLALLRMPHINEMIGPLPEEFYFPSDHLCMMARVELL
ncbi:hypothetical protein OY671_003646 [Metschnikowia pulcherrima]|nr:hypothetical protein OY671_003646 [Metschnikowia pulcherrima]